LIVLATREPRNWFSFFVPNLLRCPPLWDRGLA
jgi:hypothetical protein